MQSFEPASYLGVRFLLAAAILSPFALWRGNLSGSRVAHSLLIGAFLLVGGIFPVAYAEKSVPSNVTAVIIACAPLWFALFDRALNGTPIRRGAIAGFALGIAGVALIGRGDSAEPAQADAASIGLILLGCGTWSFSSVYARKLRPAQGLANVFFQYVAAGVLLLIFAVVFENFGADALGSVTRAGWLSLAYITLGPSLISYTAYLWLLEREPSHRISTYALVNPAVAVLAGALVLDERASLSVVGALLLVLAGTWMSFTAKAKARLAKNR